MGHFRKTVSAILLSFFIGISTSAQDATAAKSDCLKGAVIDLKDTLSAGGTPEETRAHVSLTLRRWFMYVCYFSPANNLRAQLLGKAEDKRLDKQPGASSTTAGSTSLVDKGSAPWLLGFALERGKLTQSADGSTVTLRANIVNSIRALIGRTYLGSYEIGQDDRLIRYLSRLSFAASFNVAANQGNSSQISLPGAGSFSGVSAQYKIYNHRDPRDKKWTRKWDHLSSTVGLRLAHQYTNLTSAVRRNDQKFQTWLSSQADIIVAIPENSRDQQLPSVLEDTIKSFGDNFWNLPELQKSIADFTAGISRYVESEDTVFNETKKTAIVTLDYNFVRQSLPPTATVNAMQAGRSLPDLSNLTLVLERGFAGSNAPELTFNVSGTWFSSSAVGRSNLRDARVSLQLDVPLKREIENIGKFTLSFSGQYLRLFEEPIGQKVMLKGVTIDRTGGIGVFQTKLSIPVKGSGVKIPVSFTYSNRTELIKEGDVRGNVGITFDLDSLFAKSK